MEAPEGVVNLGSPFYIERRSDGRFIRELLKAGTTTTIMGAREMGKTSLLVRGKATAEQQNFSIIFFDFLMVDSAYLHELDTFLHYLTLNIGGKFGLSPDLVAQVWQNPLSSKERLTHFLEDYILKNAAQQIVLIFDEADQLAKSTFRTEFFGLVRAWHTLRSINPLWKKLNVAMAISTQPYLLIANIDQSPFNVGLQIKLENFTLEQVQELNNRHGCPLSQAEVSEMMTLLGGLPYLVRKAFYTLIDEERSWAELKTTAIQSSGPFDAHLRKIRQKLDGQTQLIEAIKSILKTQTSSDDMALNRLISAGLIRQNESGLHQFNCQLYDRYFRRVFP